DCVLLLGLGRKESAFPVDVWIQRVVCRYYRAAVREVTGVELPNPDAEQAATPRQHNAIGDWARHAFGADVGYAQTYLFHAARAGIL
ncbi:MAG: hypothetical protein QHJ73_18030, partial [Armatimonadota bacterium]|nr:hypothetical protein [Armatimonadota bacterium]